MLQAIYAAIMDSPERRECFPEELAQEILCKPLEHCAVADLTEGVLEGYGIEASHRRDLTRALLECQGSGKFESDRATQRVIERTFAVPDGPDRDSSPGGPDRGLSREPGDGGGPSWSGAANVGEKRYAREYFSLKGVTTDGAWVEVFGPAGDQPPSGGVAPRPTNIAFGVGYEGA